MGVELLWRGHSHWTMAAVGGFCFVLIGGLNNYLPWEMPVWKQAVCGSALVTAVELVAGIILNLYLGLGIWDYSGLLQPAGTDLPAVQPAVGGAERSLHLCG